MLAPTAAYGAHQQRAITPLQAISSDSVVDAYGVGIHLNFLNTPYQDADAVASALSDLGVRHVRDDLYLDAPREYRAIATVAGKGIGFDLIMGRPGVGQPSDYVQTVADQLSPGVVESIEGVNEWDLFGGEEWVAELRAWQEGLWTAAGANQLTADLPVLSPALAFRWNYPSVGDLAPWADVANAHMYPGGHKPSNQITRITEALTGAMRIASTFLRIRSWIWVSWVWASAGLLTTVRLSIVPSFFSASPAASRLASIWVRHVLPV